MNTCKYCHEYHHEFKVCKEYIEAVENGEIEEEIEEEVEEDDEN